LIMLASRIHTTIRQVLNHTGENIALHEPCFRGNEWAYVKDCLDSTYVSSIGQYVDKFESMLADYIGVKRAVAVVNGTAALHISLKLAGVKPGDEVLVPALSFFATAAAVAYCGALPHLVDSEIKTLGLDPMRLQDYLEEIAQVRGGECVHVRTGRIIRAMVPMHTYGHPVDLEPLLQVCQRFHLELVEDAAESMGSLYQGRHTGNWGKLAILSFNGNKIITTGGGGAILTNDADLGRLAKHLTTTAKLPHRWEFFHDQIGYNYRLPNINAALGCAQMEQLPDFLEKKRALARRYEEAFQGIAGVTFFTEPEFARSNYWMNVLLLDADQAGELQRVLEFTNDHGIKTRPAWTLMHRLPSFQDCPRMDLSVAEDLAGRLINIPSSSQL
jgi:perosamine synthetase